MNNLYLALLQGVQSVRGALPSEEKVAAILAKAATVQSNQEGYAYVAGRNAAIDGLRRGDAATRRALLVEQARLQEEAEKELKASLQSELRKLALEVSMPARYVAGLLSYVDSSGLPGLMERFQISDDCAAQWRRRGIKAILPYASQALREALRRNGRKKAIQTTE